jgi:hypothetical protein
MQTWVLPKYVILPCKNRQNFEGIGYTQKLIHSSFATNGMEIQNKPWTRDMLTQLWSTNLKGNATWKA